MMKCVLLQLSAAVQCRSCAKGFAHVSPLVSERFVSEKLLQLAEAPDLRNESAVRQIVIRFAE